MRVFIVGAGEVGFNAARMLSGEGHDVTVVDSDGRLVEKASTQLDAMVMEGNGASPRVLAEAGAKSSDLLVSVTDSDEVNITACLVAKAQGVKQTVARIRNPDYYETGSPFARDVLGIDLVIHPERTAAEEIRAALRVPGSVNVESFAGRSVEVAEVALDEGSPAVGRAVQNVELPGRSLVVGVVRGSEAIVPRGDTVLEAGDHVFLISERRRIRKVVAAVSKNTGKIDEVIILGGGRIGLYLALALGEDGVSIKVIEEDAERARYVASRLKRGLVLNDEGISREFLLQEGVNRTDAFVATTLDDRSNLLASMYARQLGARTTVAVTSRAEFSPLSEALGVDVPIAPRLLTAGAILRFVRRGEVTAVTLLENGAEMIELRVPQGCAVAGKKLMEARLPKGVVVGAIMRDRQVIIPDGDDVLKPDDTAVVFTVESAVDEVENLFSG